jgi:hypothetical protein
MRLLRILRLAIAVVSLLLSLAIVVIWIRSYFTADHFSQYTTYEIENRSYRPIVMVQIGKGGIGFNRIFWSAPPDKFAGSLGNEPFNHFKQPPHYPDFRYRPSNPPVLGFKFERLGGSLPNGTTVKVFAFILPLWSLFLVFLLLAVPDAIDRYRRYQRYRNPNLCPHCGYDLRASGDICPECGQPRSPSLQTSSPAAAR